MSKWAAFRNGFLSAFDWDFTQSREDFLRKHGRNTEPFDLQKEKEKLGLSTLNPWDAVGMRLRNAMGQFAQENGIDAEERRNDHETGR